MIERAKIDGYFDTKSEIEAEALRWLPVYSTVHGWEFEERFVWKVTEIDRRYAHLIGLVPNRLIVRHRRLPTRLLWDKELQDTILQVVYVRSQERQRRRWAMRTFQSERRKKRLIETVDWREQFGKDIPERRGCAASL